MSPRQWPEVRESPPGLEGPGAALVEESKAGKCTRPGGRTVLAPGDPRKGRSLRPHLKLEGRGGSRMASVTLHGKEVAGCGQQVYEKEASALTIAWTRGGDRQVTSESRMALGLLW